MLRCLSCAKLYRGVAGAFLCELPALPLPPDALFNGLGGSGAASSVFRRCGAAGAGAAAREPRGGGGVVRKVMCLLYISQAS